MSTIKISFCGDIIPDSELMELIDLNEHDIIADLFRSSDISIANLEAQITNKQVPIRKTGMHFSIDPEYTVSLQRLGINLTCLANNHIMDYGEAGLYDTLENLDRNNIDHIGAGDNHIKAASPIKYNIKGKTISFLNISENEFSIATKNTAGANGLDPIENYHQIKKAKSESDFLFVIFHGGLEHYSLPTPKMVKTCQFFVDCGADGVICHHTHVVSGFEYYNEKPIFYGLGNFYSKTKKKNPDLQWFESVILNIKISMKNNTFSHELIPVLQNKENNGWVLLSNDKKSLFLSKLDTYNEIIKDSDLLQESYNSFIKSKEIRYLSYISNDNYIIRNLRVRNLIPRKKINKLRIALLLNLFRSESHNEAIKNILHRLLNEK